MVRIFDRFCLFLFSLTGAVSSIFLISISFLERHPLFKLLELGQIQNKTTILTVAAIFLIISLRFLYLSLRFGDGNPATIDQRTDHGDISISLETIENLTLKAASKIRGVKDLKARVQIGDQGIILKIRTFVDGDHSIPTLSEEMQRTVKEYVEELTGIPVTKVSVYVANIVQSTTFKSRVE